MKVEKQYLTEKEVARLTGRSLSTLRNERHLSKGFNYVKIGRSVRYPKADVIAFMEARKIVPASSESEQYNSNFCFRNEGHLLC